jgi:hypothetical protein
VVLMDQRGTGRSSPITTNTLAQRGTPKQQAQYLSFFRWACVDNDNAMLTPVKHTQADRQEAEGMQAK